MTQKIVRSAEKAPLSTTSSSGAGPTAARRQSRRLSQANRSRAPRRSRGILLAAGLGMTPRFLVATLVCGAVLSPGFARAEPVRVLFQEGVTRAFPVVRSLTGQKLAQGDLIQVARGDRVDSRMTFRFADGSLYDEHVVFSQTGVFSLLSYRLVQRGPSFPESLDASV